MALTGGRLREALDALYLAWTSLPADVQAPATDALATAAVLMARGLQSLGPHMKAIEGPMVRVAIQAAQDVILWQVPFDDVAGLIGARFPSAVALLQALAPGSDAKP